MDITMKISIAIIVIITMSFIIKRLMELGKRILLGILLIAFMVCISPKVNAFLINRLGEHGLLEQTLSRIVDEDIETKVKRDYEMATGEELKDEALLEELKAQAFSYNPAFSDELNILLNCGFPQGINNTLILNFAGFGTARISAGTFPDYVAKFFVLKLTTLASIFITFSAATKIFMDDREYGYRY
ncbi:MAG: hypothetical protein J5517_04785 [Eubacterium sp.]|nr:hypothetical protein [Eubacterium sp.]